MSKFLYPLFGLFVIGGYAYALAFAVEPFSASSQRGQVRTPSTSTGTSARTRSPTFIWFGGNGGK